MKYILFVISSGRPKSHVKNDIEVHITRNFSMKDRLTIGDGLQCTHCDVLTIMEGILYRGP